MGHRASTLLLSAFTAVLLHAQEGSPGSHKWYMASGGEWIFSAAQLDVNGSDQGSIIRFSPFFNAQGLANYDFSSHAGFFAGLSVRNLGFIYQLPDTAVRYKFRTYNLGIPVGFKVGTMGKGLLFAGYELEIPFNYKEKRFENEKKEDKFNVWFSDRTEPIFHSVMLGYQFPFGTCIKFKYYLTNFHNKDFTEEKDGVTTKPYAGLNANIIYVSLGWDLFRQAHYSWRSTPVEKQAYLRE